MAPPGTVHVNFQQMLAVVDGLAGVNTANQMGSAAGVFESMGLPANLADLSGFSVDLKINQFGQAEVSFSLPPAVRFSLPQVQAQAPSVTVTTHPGAAEVAQENPALVYTGPEVHSSAPPYASTGSRAFSYSALVFSQPQLSRLRTDQLPSSLIPSRAGDAPAPKETARSTSEAPKRPQSERLEPAQRPQGGVSLPTASVEHVPLPVRELLTHLQLLPPGTRTEDVLPRFQEVVRLWGLEASRHSDLHPEVVRAVNHFLASAVLSVAFGDSQVPGQAQRAGQPQGHQPQTNPLFAASPTQLPQISSARIAEAVMNLLSGAQLPTLQTAPQVLRPQTQSLPHQPQRPPSIGPAANPLGTSGVQAANLPPAGKPEAFVRTDPSMGRPIVREEVREPRVIVRPDAGPVVREEIPRPEVPSQGDYERDARSELAYDGHAALEALWPTLHQELRAAGFIDDRSGSIRILRSADEGRTLLAVLADRVPAEFDPLDLLELIGQKIGWGERGSPVNEAFARLAGYRGLSDRTKAGALLEPLRDVIVILGMGHEGLTGTEISLLSRFEAHLPVAEMFLENEAWFDRLENKTSDSRATLESEMEEARNLYVDYLARQHGMRNLFNAPPAPRLLN